MNAKPKVLLTANYTPNALGLGEDMTDLMSTRWMRKHGPFQMDMYGHYFALYLLAENISCPTTVLENPSWDEFDHELGQGYDYVGFQLKSIHTRKIREMMERIREKSPGTKIVVGGHGVPALDYPVPGDKEGDALYIRENADYLCRGEGVSYLREVLGDEPAGREITQYHTPMFSLGKLTGGDGIHMRIPSVLVSLGCPNGCDFCNTSAMYKQQKIYVAEPEQVYRYIRHYQRRMGFKEIIVMLWDEDFFQNPEYVRELGRLLRSHKSTWCVRYYTFGSIKALSQFEPEEIRDNGCQQVWVGVESFQTGEGMVEDRYHKRQGKGVNEVIEGLRSNGVQITGSMVLGLDFHTRENMKEDIDKFVDLKPMFYQISHVLPCPGTALYDRMVEEERIKDGYRWEDLHFWSSHLFEYNKFERKDIQEMFEYAHDRLRDVNGPPVLQMMESVMDAHLKFRDDPDPFRQALVKRDVQIASGFHSFIPAIKNHHPSPMVRERAAMLERRYKDEIGNLSMAIKALGAYISRNIKKRANEAPAAPVSDPPSRWTYYNTFGDEVWFKKSGEHNEPVPYTEGSIIAGPKLNKVLPLVGKGMKSWNSLQKRL